MAQPNLNKPATLSPQQGPNTPPIPIPGYDQRVGGRSQVGGLGQSAKGAGNFGGLPPRLPQAIANKLQQGNRRASLQQAAFSGRKF
jgi:hypothetical protein